MPADQLFAKDSGGTWRQARPLYVKEAGAWVRVKEAWVKQAGSWVQVYGDALALNCAGTVTGAFTWDFAWSIFSGGSNPGGGAGCSLTLEDTATTLLIDTYTDAASSGSASISTDSTASYTAKLYDKAGALVDTVTFTPA